jgi:NAD(P)-dependent dehydrogenase (short-subunit alcohol dehydrogenase family)
MPVSTSKTILVTGTSTGIGRDLTRYLAERGHTVYATVRREDDLIAWRSVTNVIPLLLDVSDPVQVQAARRRILDDGHSLYGLVHNAGIGEMGLLGFYSYADMQRVFDVNVFGPHRLTNALVDLLIANRGRIVNISSQGGLITGKYLGPYIMSKHALEAYTDCLRAELARYGVWVAAVQPGGIDTNMGARSIDSVLARLRASPEVFKEEADQLIASLEEPAAPPDPDAPESATNRKPSPPSVVSEAVHRALFDAHPKRSYLVGTKWEGDRVIRTLIEKLLDANDSPHHNFNRDELVALLDRHLAERRLDCS